MPLTRKFSQFVAQNVSSVVGLTGGANSIGPNSGGGGSGAVTQVIVQANSFTVGQWIRFDVASNLYVTALATTPLNAEVIGVVIAATATQFTLQQSGYITAVQAVFAGLLDGEPYFLDNVVAGNMVTTDVLIDGEVSRPVFIPDSPASGWVLPYRGVIVGGGPDTGGSSPSPSTDSNVVTVVQNGHGFNPGQWVRVDTPTVGPNQVHYILAIATSLANSQAVGVVIEVINANEFVLQFAGYIATNGTVFAPFQDQAAAPLVPKTVYYLSSTVAGAITSVDPGLTPGNFSKPLYISEQTIGTVNFNAGYILPQRPLSSSTINPNNSGPIFLGYLNSANGFSSTTILQDPTTGSTFNAYQLYILNGAHPAGGIDAHAAVPCSLGLELYIGGAFTGALYNYYLSGIFGPIPTNWSMAQSGAAAPSLVIFPPFSKDPSLTSGTLFLDNFSGGHIMTINASCQDTTGVFVGYTMTGVAGNNSPGVATGLRVFASNAGVVNAASGGYIAVYGIQNS